MKRKLKTISNKLKKASKAHASQAKQIDDIMKKQSALKLKKSPALKKLSAGITIVCPLMKTSITLEVL